MAKPSPAGAQRQVRDSNVAAVLGCVRALGTSRVSEVAELSGLSLPTVRKALVSLTAEGLVNEEPASRQGRGRPARMVAFQPRAWLVAGVDAGPHRVTVTLGDLAGETVASHELRSSRAQSARRLVGQVGDVLDGALAQVGRARTDLAAWVVGVPGIRVPRGHHLAPAIPDLEEFDLTSALTSLVDCPLEVENDVNLAVVAEHELLVDPEATVLLIQWGSRVGAGLMVSGRLHRGAHGAAGEIGYFDLDRHHAGPAPPGLGRFEGTVSLPRRTPDRFASVTGWLEAARTGDQEALTALDGVCQDLARGAAPLVLALDPTLLIIGGPAAGGGEALLDRLRPHLAARLLVPPRVQLSRLGQGAVICGALKSALARAEDRLLSPW